MRQFVAYLIIGLQKISLGIFPLDWRMVAMAPPPPFLSLTLSHPSSNQKLCYPRLIAIICFILCSLQELNISHYIISQDKSVVSVVSLVLHLHLLPHKSTDAIFSPASSEKFPALDDYDIIIQMYILVW